MHAITMALDPLDLARWQFAITTVYHFILVPLTIGMSLAVAILQTLWYKTKKDHWLKATQFFGKLFLINFALGVATGIVQEFQFGMNWSEYARFVGDIFGAPLAVEALLAFFIESTFLGLWIFGWGKLSPKVHTLCIWMVAIGVNVSALWIVGANSWMQHPVGAVFNPATGRAELDGALGFFNVVLNHKLWLAISHVIASSWLIAGTFIAGIATWWLVRSANAGEEGMQEARKYWKPITRFGILVLFIGGLATVVSGHFQGQDIAKSQPMKLAAAEGLCESQKSAPFTLAVFGNDCKSATRIGEIPGLASFLADDDFSSEVVGIKQANELYKEKLASAHGLKVKDNQDYTPPFAVTFWAFRIMILTGLASLILGVWLVISTRKNKIPTSKALGKFAIFAVPFPFLGASFGWIFAEVGRQPFVVAPNLLTGANDPVSSVYMLTYQGVSPLITSGEVLTTLVVFTLLYLGLGIVWFLLMRRYSLEGIHKPAVNHNNDEVTTALSFEY
ncbi:cytochrome ubiquinol oxidase subunit I [Actinomyces sp. zg-332]|uniref:cytochrome ubiquinol oxidase subunit I n=1 Tax=Actinomyces sp. zg-332 TaxID=2708340 RepID=UPI001E4A4CE4|nr:cytochrome ubiquinol oxidase subunit I [Actinomyces sp. zg-332]